VPILAPLADVAVHVLQAPCVGRSLPDRPKDRRRCFAAPSEGGQGRAVIPEETTRRGTSPAGVFPFGLCGQTVDPPRGLLLRLLGQSLRDGNCILPGNRRRWERLGVHFVGRNRGPRPAHHPRKRTLAHLAGTHEKRLRNPHAMNRLVRRLLLIGGARAHPETPRRQQDQPHADGIDDNRGHSQTLRTKLLHLACLGLPHRRRRLRKPRDRGRAGGGGGLNCQMLGEFRLGTVGEFSGQQGPRGNPRQCRVAALAGGGQRQRRQAFGEVRVPAGRGPDGARRVPCGGGRCVGPNEVTRARCGGPTDGATIGQGDLRATLRAGEDGGRQVGRREGDDRSNGAAGTRHGRPVRGAKART
jgi:hypothetical protein